MDKTKKFIKAYKRKTKNENIWTYKNYKKVRNSKVK